MTLPAAKNLGRIGYAAALGVALLVARGASAQPQPQTLLLWAAPPECPQRDDVLAAVREITGDEVLANTSLHASGEITEVKDRFRLQLSIEGDRGTYARTLDARNCGDLLNAAAVVLGLNLKRMAREEEAPASDDPASQQGAQSNAATSTASDAAKPAASAAPTPNANDAASNRPPAPLRDDSPPTWWVGLPEVHGALGALPEPTLWWGASIGKRWGPWLTSVSGRFHLPQQVQSVDSSDIGALVTRYGLSLGVARGWRSPSFELAPGIGVGLEHLLVRGTGENLVSAEARSNVLLIGASLTGRWFVTTWLSTALALGGDIPTVRPRFVVQSLGDQGQLGGVIGRISLSIEWNF